MELHREGHTHKQHNIISVIYIILLAEIAYCSSDMCLKSQVNAAFSPEYVFVHLQQTLLHSADSFIYQVFSRF